MNLSRPSAAGYTLIEIMTVVAILSILVALAAPGLQSLRDRTAISGSIDMLATSLRLARSHALRLNDEVSVCAREPQSDDASPRCAAHGGDWSGGWLVFVDHGQRGEIDGDDRLLQVYQPPAGPPHVLASPKRHAVTFQRSGISLNAATNFLFVPAWARPGDANVAGAKRVCINKPGKLRTLPGADPCQS